MPNNEVIDALIAAAREDNDNRVAQAHNSSELNYDRPESNKTSLRRKIGTTVLGAFLIGATGIGFVAYGISKGLGPHVENHIGVAQGGHGTIEKIDMTMPPITLATTDTKVTGERVAYKDTIKGLGLSVDFNQHALTRAATVETLITLDPKKVEVTFDKAKDKLIYSLPDRTLTTKVNLVNTDKDHPVSTKPSGSLSGFLTDPGASIAENFAGTFGNDATSVPLLGEMAKGKLNIQNGLETFADLAITSGVDKECTPLLKTLPTFTEQLDENIKTVMDGPIRARDDLVNLLQIPQDKSYTETKKLIDKYVSKAVVEMPTDYAIGPDQTALTSLSNYIKSEKFSVDGKVPPITCGVSENAKLSLVDTSKG